MIDDQLKPTYGVGRERNTSTATIAIRGGVTLLTLQILEKLVVHMAAFIMVESIDCVPQHVLHTISVHMVAGDGPPNSIKLLHTPCERDVAGRDHQQ